MSIAAEGASSFSRNTVNDLILLAFFVACILPVTVGELGVNYLFVAYPAWLLVSGRRLQWPPRMLLLAFGWYVLIFVAGVIVDSWSGEGPKLRSVSSFLIFVSIFGLIFFDLTAREIRIFKLAILTAALAFAGEAVFNFYWAGGNDLGFGQKDIVGSQRYGFVYFLAFCIVMSKRPGFDIAIVPKIVIVGFLLAGMLLTFSRSTAIMFVAVIGISALVSALENRRSLSDWAREMARSTSLVGVCLVALALIMPLPFSFYNSQIMARYVPVLEHLSDPVMTSSTTTDDPAAAIVEDVFNEAGSEGTRLVLWSIAIEHATEHPILGSRYLGIWTLEGAPSGSAHNQLIDVLLRTGWVGLAVYLFLLGWILFCLFRVDRGLFWGLVGALIYGVFHETFKESQGAFLLAFMMGILATSARSGHSAAPSNASREVSGGRGGLVSG